MTACREIQKRRRDVVSSLGSMSYIGSTCMRPKRLRRSLIQVHAAETPPQEQAHRPSAARLMPGASPTFNDCAGSRAASFAQASPFGDDAQFLKQVHPYRSSAAPWAAGPTSIASEIGVQLVREGAWAVPRGATAQSSPPLLHRPFCEFRLHQTWASL